MKNKKREITLLIIGILGLVSLMVGATYAYFKAQIGPAAISDITTTTATTDNFTFSTDGEIVLNVTAENLANGQGDVQDSSVAKARLIANNKTNTATKQYNVYFLIEENDIEYSSYTKEGTTQSFKTSKEKENFDLTGYEPVPEMVMSVRKNGSVYSSDIKRINKLSDNTYDITEEEGLYLIGENVSITSTKDVTDTWEVIITYKNLSTNQQLNVGHSLKGKIMITTEELLYEINDAEDLRQLSTEVNAGDTKEGKYYVLTEDIDLGEPQEGVSNFTPIGTNTNRFKGNFNGDNHTISNLYINQSYSGLFGAIENSYIINLKIKGEILTTFSAAGIVCYVYGDSRLNKIFNYVNVTNTTSGGSIGGIVAVIRGKLKITRCINYGNISNSYDTGGIIAYNNGDLILNDCQNYGKIYNSLGRTIGGLIANTSNTSTTYIFNSHNEGEINGLDSHLNGWVMIGGLIGTVNNGLQIEESYNNGVIYSNIYNNYSVGGLVGYLYQADKTIIDKITNSYNTSNGKIVGGNMKGGLIGTLVANINIENCYNEANFKDNIPTLNHENWQGQIYYGGLIGNTLENNNLNIHIKNSHNLGNIDLDTETKGSIIYGGILGTVRSNVNIENCFNSGDISLTAPAMFVGGILGYGDRKGDVIINKVYNSGDIFYNDTSDSWKDSAGGIVGYISYETIYILNSFNSGYIGYNKEGTLYGELSGIFGRDSFETNSISHYIINSYNSGIIESPDIGTGIVLGDSHVSSTINNVFNIGKVSGKTAYAIYNLSSGANNKINNTYYLDNVANGGNISSISPIKKLEQDMKSQTFVDELNNNIKSLNLEEIDPLLKDYTLVNWKLGEDGYPTLDF